MSGRELVRVVCGEAGCGRRLATVTATTDGPRWEAQLPAAGFDRPIIGPAQDRVDVRILDTSTDEGPALEVRCARHPSGLTMSHAEIVQAVRRATRVGGTRQKVPVPDRPRPASRFDRPPSSTR